MIDAAPAPACALTIDVEDWFHILDLETTPDVDGWSALESRVERGFHALLELLARHDVRATCFFLGWVAERFPHLVHEAKRAGHEIGSHGLHHTLVYTMTADAFREDARRSRELLEDLSGSRVLGYRAAGFSVTENTPWFFDEVAEAGFAYSSSIFPASRGHGGMAGGRLEPYVVETRGRPVVEAPVTVAETCGRRMCFFGGGYLRLFPYALVERMTRRVLAEGRPVIFYVHPREADPEHPRLPMPAVRRFKSYVNLDSMMPKLDRLMERLRFRPLHELVLDPSTTCIP